MSAIHCQDVFASRDCVCTWTPTHLRLVVWRATGVCFETWVIYIWFRWDVGSNPTGNVYFSLKIFSFKDCTRKIFSSQISFIFIFFFYSGVYRWGFRHVLSLPKMTHVAKISWILDLCWLRKRRHTDKIHVLYVQNV